MMEETKLRKWLAEPRSTADIIRKFKTHSFLPEFRRVQSFEICYAKGRDFGRRVWYWATLEGHYPKAAPAQRSKLQVLGIDPDYAHTINAKAIDERVAS